MAHELHVAVGAFHRCRSNVVDGDAGEHGIDDVEGIGPGNDPAVAHLPAAAQHACKLAAGGGGIGAALTNVLRLVAVGDGARVATLYHVHAVAAFIVTIRQTVDDGMTACVAPAVDDARVGGGSADTAREEAVLDGGGRLGAVAEDAAAMGVGGATAGDGGCHLAVVDVVDHQDAAGGVVGGRLGEAHESGTVHRTIDGARGLHVLDSGAVDVAEGGSTLILGVGNVDVQRVALPVEDAHEGMGVGSHRQ